MNKITIELTDTQLKGLEYVALSPQEWAENAVTERARIANDEIVKLVVEQCLNNGEQIPTTREEIVAHGFECGLVKTAAEHNAEAEAQMAEMAPQEEQE
jgi:hypothetical protein